MSTNQFALLAVVDAQIEALSKVRNFLSDAAELEGELISPQQAAAKYPHIFPDREAAVREMSRRGRGTLRARDIVVRLAGIEFIPEGRLIDWLAADCQWAVLADHCIQSLAKIKGEEQ